MSRPMVLVCLLVILIITSQFEWKQQLVNDQEIQNISQKQHVSPREEVVKEKIILSQDKRIQKLNKLIQNLQEQLVQCQGSSNDTAYGTTNLLSASNKKPLDQQQIFLDD